MDNFNETVDKIENIIAEMEALQLTIPTMSDEKMIDDIIRKITLLAYEVEKLTQGYTNDEVEDEWKLF